MLKSSSPLETSLKPNSANYDFDAFSPIADELAQVRKLIGKELLDCSHPVRRLVKHISFRKGKMLRPALVLLCGRLCGSITSQHILTAATMEIIHNATLLHDDVIDESKNRRGLPTLNCLQGNESAVLLGDFLLSRVFRMSIQLDENVSKVIAKATALTCEGEIKQTAQRGKLYITELQYLKIITDKSAAMFSAACRLGALLAGADNHQQNKLDEYGLNIGIAFQITDDILDLIGDNKKTGKNTGNDLDRDKLTLPLIHLLKKVSTTERNLITQIISKQNTSKSNGSLLKKLYNSGSIEYSVRRAKKFINKAISALSSFNESIYKKSLVETAKFITDRVC